MKKMLSILALAAAFSISLHAENIHPKASAEATVTAGKARFTVLTPRLVRMEWSEDGLFEDRATLGIVNRDLPVPEFKSRLSSGKTVITTSVFTLTYTGNDCFSEDNLTVVFSMADPSARKGVRTVTWRPGMPDSGNLLGTCRTLDGADGETTRDPFDKGPVSRDGWAVIDESARHVLEPVDADWKYWVAERPEGKRQDLYLFLYGHDYKSAVQDFTRIGGQIPLPPKWSLGYWWCRYWEYSDFEFVDLAKEIRSLGIPIDIMVLDMDWHETWSCFTDHPKRDESGEGEGWTGYTWNAKLFPNPANTLQDLHDLGLKTTLNLHPASGLQVFEEPYERFVKDYTSRTRDYDGPQDFVKPDGTRTFVPFRIDQMEWADAYFNSVIHPFEKQGVDFWWLDWQQWKESRYTNGLSNTFWLNYTFFGDMVRQSEHQGPGARRPMIYHRWGGIGSHRYQIGFSGDTYASWKVLGYLPWFTSTASNVGYGYWGHDIGGHMQPKGVESTNPELYTRWLQYGVFTPIFKTHSTKDATMEKRFWMFPEYFDDMRAAIRLRYSLSPYIYGAAREAFDSGISICRPMYYDWPEDARAYEMKQQFMFGDDILATVVCEAADPATGLAARKIWLPDGEWYDVATGTLYGGGEYNLSYTVHENPWFVKAGAVIPMAAPDISSLQESSNEIWLFTAPGDGSSQACLYEDDGLTQAYGRDFARTRISKESDASRMHMEISAREGSYKGAPDTRLVRVKLEGVPAPARVTVDGRDVPYSRFAASEASKDRTKAVWGYEGSDLAAVIYLPEAPAASAVTVDCFYDAQEGRVLLDGKKGILHRAMELTPEAKLRMKLRTLPDAFMLLSQTASFITEDPYGAAGYLESIDLDAVSSCFEGTPAREFGEKVTAQTRL